MTITEAARKPPEFWLVDCCERVSASCRGSAGGIQGNGRYPAADADLKQVRKEHWFSRFASEVATRSGRPGPFALAVCFVVVWLVSGPIFGFSDTWQLIMNTVSSIVTFLMVFLIQNTQNRDSAALQLKLDELIRANAARKDLVGIEEKPESEIESKRRETHGN